MESTATFLMRRERSRRAFQVTLTRLRRIDRVSLQPTGHPCLSRQIRGLGQFLVSPEEGGILVDGLPMWSLPLEVTLLFTALERYTDGRRALGRLEFLQPMQNGTPVRGQPAKLTLELALPLDLEPRFAGSSGAPVLTVSVSGPESLALGASTGSKAYAWDTNASASLTVEECVIADPEPPAAAEAAGRRPQQATG